MSPFIDIWRKAFGLCETADELHITARALSCFTQGAYAAILTPKDREQLTEAYREAAERLEVKQKETEL